MIYAIWPRFRNIPNKLPESANINTGFMICYFIYWVMCLPFHYIPPHQVRWFFTFKSVVTPIAGFVIIGWIVSRTGMSYHQSRMRMADRNRRRKCYLLTRK